MNKIISYKEQVQEMMNDVICSRKKINELFEDTLITNFKIDESGKRAAFVVREKIDSDEGVSGNQHKHTVYHIKNYDKPKQIYSDDSHLRTETNHFTNSIGKDTSITLEHVLSEGVLARIVPKGRRSNVLDFSQLDVEISLDGVIEDLTPFIDVAENLVKKIKNGSVYDGMKESYKLTCKNVAALIWNQGKGTARNLDTMYLVWKTETGKLESKWITDSTNNLYIISINSDGDNILLNTGKVNYEFSFKELGLNGK